MKYTFISGKPFSKVQPIKKGLNRREPGKFCGDPTYKSKWINRQSMYLFTDIKHTGSIYHDCCFYNKSNQEMVAGLLLISQSHLTVYQVWNDLWTKTFYVKIKLVVSDINQSMKESVRKYK